MPPRDATTSSWDALLARCTQLTFRPDDLATPLDQHGRYERPLLEEFPFAIAPLHYRPRQHARGTTWHRRLELFLPLDGQTIFRMGDRSVELEAGDLLVVDNLQLHQVVDFRGFDTRALVVTFLPEFVYSLGSPPYDYAFLLPFYPAQARRPRVLSLVTEADATAAINRLVGCWAAGVESALQRAGCKAFLLELLFEVARRFPASELQQFEFLRQQQRTLRLKPLFDHVSERYAERLTIGRAAALVGMSHPQFMKIFKKAAGMTLMAYLNHVRLANGSRLLRETSLTIAEIASAVGFSDQSYFDKRFKRAFGRTPTAFRTARCGPDPLRT